MSPNSLHVSLIAITLLSLVIINQCSNTCMFIFLYFALHQLHGNVGWMCDCVKKCILGVGVWVMVGGVLFDL